MGQGDPHMNDHQEMDIYLIYVTTADAAEASRIAAAIVSERLAACGNVMPQMQATYWWNGQVQQDDECVLILKTAADRLEALQARVGSLHSYELPCVIALKIDAVSDDYRAWIITETRTKPVADGG